MDALALAQEITALVQQSGLRDDPSRVRIALSLADNLLRDAEIAAMEPITSAESGGLRAESRAAP